MTGLAQKKKILVSTVCRVVKKKRGKRLRRSRKPLFSAVIVKKHPFVELPEESRESNSRFFLKRLIFYPVFSKQNERVERLGMMFLNTAECQQLSIQPQAWCLWRRSIERGEDTSSLVWCGKQANLCRLQRSCEDESFFMSQEDH